MRQLFTHYIVQKHKTDINIRAIRNLLKELREQKIKDTKYCVYQMGENAFIHIAHFKSEKAGKILFDMPVFKEFLRCLQECLEEDPIVINVNEIGSYPAL